MIVGAKSAKTMRNCEDLGGVLEILPCFPCIGVSVTFKLRDLGKMIYMGLVRMDGSKE